jgi:hypothetical protein
MHEPPSRPERAALVGSDVKIVSWQEPKKRNRQCRLE